MRRTAFAEVKGLYEQDKQLQFIEVFYGGQDVCKKLFRHDKLPGFPAHKPNKTVSFRHRTGNLRVGMPGC